MSGELDAAQSPTYWTRTRTTIFPDSSQFEIGAESMHSISIRTVFFLSSFLPLTQLTIVNPLVAQSATDTTTKSATQSATQDNAATAEKPTLGQQRMAIMVKRAGGISFTAAKSLADFPPRLHDKPIFRYDDQTRGYVDGTIWRLGRTGRPKAIITTELHPRYLGQPRVVYDLLSISPHKFTASSDDFIWSPNESAVEFLPITGDDVKPPATTATRRLSQMKHLAKHFSATQDVENVLVQLRLLPTPIDRYTPGKAKNSDGAIFLFVNGRNPGLIMFVETDGTKWEWSIGRLSHPSTLTLKLRNKTVWSQPTAQLGSNLPYQALNAPATIPMPPKKRSTTN